MTRMDEDKLKIEFVNGSCQKGNWQFQEGEAFSKLAAEHIKNDSLVVAWFNHQVLWGRYNGQNLTWAGAEPEWKQFIEARIFNPKEELYLNRCSWRYRQDGEGTECYEAVDSSGRLWGEWQSQEGDVAVLGDLERKLQLKVPVVARSRYYELAIRSYIQYDAATGQAGYGDYRYLDLTEGRDR